MKERFDDLAERFADHSVDVDPGTWNAISGKLAVANGSSLSALLQDKFAGHETAVDPQVWADLSTQLGHGASASVSTVAGWLKVGIAATVVAGGVLVYSLASEGTTPATVEKTHQAAPAAKPDPTKEQQVAPVAVTVAPRTIEDHGSPTPVVHVSDKDERTPAAQAAPTEHKESNRAVETHAEDRSKVLPPPTPEGQATVNAVLQDLGAEQRVEPAADKQESISPPAKQTPDVSGSPDRSTDTEAGTATEEAGSTAALENIPEMTVLIPTAFSPNGDGTNDELFVSVQNYQKAAVRIFSASNNALVFAADNLEVKWNGRVMNGSQPCEPGMYFYALEITDANGRTSSKGEVVRLFR